MLQLFVFSPALHVLLIRHGETVWNAEGRVQGAADSALTEHGVQQAQTTGRRLAKMSQLQREIYTSPLPRARRTAELIAAELADGAYQVC